MHSSAGRFTSSWARPNPSEKDPSLIAYDQRRTTVGLTGRAIGRGHFGRRIKCCQFNVGFEFTARAVFPYNNQWFHTISKSSIFASNFADYGRKSTEFSCCPTFGQCPSIGRCHLQFLHQCRHLHINPIPRRFCFQTTTASSVSSDGSSSCSCPTVGQSTPSTTTIGSNVRGSSWFASSRCRICPIGTFGSIEECCCRNCGHYCCK